MLSLLEYLEFYKNTNFLKYYSNYLKEPWVILFLSFWVWIFIPSNIVNMSNINKRNGINYLLFAFVLGNSDSWEA